MSQLEVVWSSMRPQDFRTSAPTGQKDRMMVVRTDVKLFGAIQELARQGGYFGLDVSSSFAPGVRGSTTVALVGALTRGLKLVDEGRTEKPFDTFRQPAARAAVERIIELAQLGLGLVLKKGQKVERINEARENRVPAKEEKLAPQLAGFCYRPQAETR